VITKPEIPVVPPVRIADDERFLKWLARAKEALPAPPPSAGESEAAEAIAEDPPPVKEVRNVDDIPEAIVVKHKDSSGRGRSSGSGGAPRKTLRNLAGEIPTGRVPQRRRATDAAARADAEDVPALDVSRIVTFDEYNEGKTHVEPLERGNVQDGKQRLEKPKFLDGKLPRSVERGVLHPEPRKVIITALFLIATKLLTIAVLITFPIIVYIDGRTLIPKFMPLLIAFVVVGIIYIFRSSKTHCRVCSCHLFYVRSCHMHKQAHRARFLGRATSAAFHLLLFRWMRCMYCGTAIRMRGSSGVGKPKKVEEGEG